MNNNTNSEWVAVSVRRGLYDQVVGFVDARRDATITNIGQFVDLAIRAKLHEGVVDAVVEAAVDGVGKGTTVDGGPVAAASVNVTKTGVNTTSRPRSKIKSVTPMKLEKPRGGESEI